MNKQKYAFTLVELIVVITILAILWTIAFISLQWYSKQARDSTRISDLSSMKTSLELFNLEAWKFPVTTDWFIVTYSWSTVWTQWVFWAQTISSVEILDKIPTDPLVEREYTYSVTKNRQEYQLAWVLEWDDVANINILNETNAWDQLAKAIIKWSYNWVTLKSLSWSTCSILSLPSIISSQDETVTNLTDILTSNWLVYEWYNNLPTNYRSSKYNAEWWFAFASNQLIVYSDTDECSSIYDADDSTARNTMLSNIQTAYSGTILESESNINQLVNLDLNLQEVIWSSVVTNYLWWNLVSTDTIPWADQYFSSVVWLMNMNDPVFSGIMGTYNSTLPTCLNMAFWESKFYNWKTYKVDCSSASTDWLSAPWILSSHCAWGTWSTHGTYWCTDGPVSYWPSLYYSNPTEFGSADTVTWNTYTFPVSSVFYSSATSVFGTYSLNAISTSAMTVADDPKFTLNWDFTIEMFVNPTDSSQNYFFEYGDISLNWYAATEYIKYNISLSEVLAWNTTVSIWSWAHVALVRKNWVIKLYTNWIEWLTSSTDPTIFDPTPTTIWVWAPIWALSNIYIDGIRVTNWVARYDGNFTPPTEAFPVY